MTTNNFWDRIGISASILCGIHCLLTPILVLSAPVFGNIFSHQAFHWIIALVVFPAAMIGLWLGYRVHHHPRMLLLGGVGLFFIAIGIVAGADAESNLETATMIIAGIFLTSAHVLNLRACRTASLKSTPGRPPPPHDHSSSAKVSPTKLDGLKSENV